MGLRGPLLDHLLLFPFVPSINQRIKTAERAGRGDKSTHVRSTRTVERKFSAALPVALCSLRLCYRAFRSGPSWTISRTDAAHEVGHGVANLVGAILLEEMAPFHRHFGLVQPGATKFPLPADQNRTWIRIDEKLRDIG